MLKEFSEAVKFGLTSVAATDVDFQNRQRYGFPTAIIIGPHLGAIGPGLATVPDIKQLEIDGKLEYSQEPCKKLRRTMDEWTFIRSTHNQQCDSTRLDFGQHAPGAGKQSGKRPRSADVERRLGRPRRQATAC